MFKKGDFISFCGKIENDKVIIEDLEVAPEKADILIKIAKK